MDERIAKNVQTITVCNPTMYEMVFETNNNKVTGIFAPFILNYMNIFLQMLNASLVAYDGYPGVGQRIGQTDMYDGCLGILQRGEADLIIAGMDYPSDIVNISQGFIVREERVSFSGLFPRPESVHKADFSRSLFAFPWPVYLLILVYLVVFGLICTVRRRLKRWTTWMSISNRPTAQGTRNLKLKMKIRKKIEQRARHSPGFVDVFRTFIGTKSIEPDSYVLTVVVLSINLFSFFIITAYFNSLLNPELVIPEQALIYESYGEIMKAGVKPLFFEGFNAYHYLKYAKEGSKGKQFWDWAVKKFGEENLMMPVSMKSFQHGVEVVAGRALIFLGNLITPLLRSSICGVLDRSFERLVAISRQIADVKLDVNKYKDLQFYTRTDPSAIKKIKTIVMGRRVLDSPKLYLTARILFLRSFEHGHIEAVIQVMQQAELASAVPGAGPFFGPLAPERSQMKQRCNNFNHPDPKIPDIDQVSLENFRFSFAFCAALMALSMLIVLLENCANRSKRRNQITQ